MSAELKVLIRGLAHNDRAQRDDAVQQLSKWIKSHFSDLKSDVREDGAMMKLWKGLFYCFWMSDKQELQMELASRLSGLVLTIPEELVPIYLSSFYETLGVNWNSLDQYRLNKYYVLTRRMVTAGFEWIRRRKWDEDAARVLRDMYRDSVLFQGAPQKRQKGVLLHVIDVFVPELMVVLGRERTPVADSKKEKINRVVETLLAPLLELLIKEKDERVALRVQESCFLPIGEALVSKHEENLLFDCIQSHAADWIDRFEKGAKKSKLPRRRKDLLEIKELYAGISSTEE